MQGFIININRVKEEDLIVTIVTRNSLDTLYRFYGARHGVINLGFKIDYEKESSAKSTIARLKDVVHLGTPWLKDRHRLILWQHYIALFYNHLKEADDIGTFYFDLLDESAQKWEKQNPKRVAVESYIKLLQHEGRLHTQPYCFLCSQKITTSIALIRAYLPTHPHCSRRNGITPSSLNELYTKNSSLFLTDKEIDMLWDTLMEGL